MHASVNSLRQCLFVSGMLVCLLCMYLCMLYLHVHCVCNVCNISTSSFSYISLFGFLISSVFRAACMLTSECSELSKAVHHAWRRQLCEDQYLHSQSLVHKSKLTLSHAHTHHILTRIRVLSNINLYFLCISL